MKINSKTLFLAADIAKKSKPCRGALQKLDGSMCILGCVLKANSRLSKKRFDVFMSERKIEDAVRVATGSKRRLNLFVQNDSPAFTDMLNGLLIDKLRDWQVEKLTRLAKKAYQKECNE